MQRPGGHEGGAGLMPARPSLTSGEPVPVGGLATPKEALRRWESRRCRTASIRLMMRYVQRRCRYGTRGRGKSRGAAQGSYGGFSLSFEYAGRRLVEQVVEDRHVAWTCHATGIPAYLRRYAGERASHGGP